MKNLWTALSESTKSWGQMSPEAVLYKALPHFFMEIVRTYLRVKVEGVENLPRAGGALIAPNHSGYAGLDAMLMSYLIHEHSGRNAKVMTHSFWFLSPATAVPATKLGFVEATKEEGMKLLKAKELVVLFPEGEYGNFKPSTKAYRLQEFKRGFVRMALESQCPIVPTIVIGAEETHINLSQLKFSRYLRGLVIPLPLNVIPLPAKWKIVFLEPIYLPYKPKAADDCELVHEICSDIRERMQKAINKELKNRESIFL